MVCFYSLPRPVFKRDCSIAVFVRSNWSIFRCLGIRQLQKRRSCFNSIEVSAELTVKFFMNVRNTWHIKIWKIMILFERIRRFDFLFAGLKVLLCYLNILIHFTKLIMFLFDFFFDFYFPFFNLSEFSFMTLWRNSVINEFFLSFFSFNSSLLLNFLLEHFSLIVKFLNLILQNKFRVNTKIETCFFISFKNWASTTFIFRGFLRLKLLF